MTYYAIGNIIIFAIIFIVSFIWTWFFHDLLKNYSPNPKWASIYLMALGIVVMFTSAYGVLYYLKL